LGQQIKDWTYKEWKRCPQPGISRLLLETINKKETTENVTINYIKIKGHAGHRGNEEADQRAKAGLNKENRYINKADIVPHLNTISLKHNNKEIHSNYRKEIKKIHTTKIMATADEDKNTTWKRMRKTEHIPKISNSFLKNKNIKKGIVSTIIKARTDLLPHAKQMHERKCENIKTPNCPLCTNIEDTEHILLICPEYEQTREKTKNKVYQMLFDNFDKRDDIEVLKKLIPCWFGTHEEESENLNPFPKLKSFDKLAGALGYVPTEIREVLKQFVQNTKGKNKKKGQRINKILTNIHTITTKGAHKIWLSRNKAWETRNKNRPDRINENQTEEGGIETHQQVRETSITEFTNIVTENHRENEDSNNQVNEQLTALTYTRILPTEPENRSPENIQEGRTTNNNKNHRNKQTPDPTGTRKITTIRPSKKGRDKTKTKTKTKNQQRLITKAGKDTELRRATIEKTKNMEESKRKDNPETVISEIEEGEKTTYESPPAASQKDGPITRNEKPQRSGITAGKRGRVNTNKENNTNKKQKTQMEKKIEKRKRQEEEDTNLNITSNGKKRKENNNSMIDKTKKNNNSSQ
jgi:hypothetical protein